MSVVGRKGRKEENASIMKSVLIPGKRATYWVEEASDAVVQVCRLSSGPKG